ncbi:MAG: hypothetical protein AB7O98_16190 [Hyphomonadaceae bacterium]
MVGKQQAPWDAELAAPLPQHFRPHEQWAWRQIARGDVADMRHATGADDGKGEDPAQADSWPDHRKLSAEFLRAVLFLRPWSEVRASPWVRIHAARVEEDVAWRSETTTGGIEMTSCRFDKRLMLWSLTAEKGVILDGSYFAGDVEAYGLVAEGLAASQAHFEGHLIFEAARFRRFVNLSGSTVKGAVFAQGAELGSALRCGKLKCAGRFDVSDSKIEEFIDLSEAELGAGFDLARTALEGTLSLASATFKGGLLDYAAIGGNLVLSGAKCSDDFSAGSAHIGGQMIVKDATFEARFIMSAISVAGQIDFAKCKLGGFVNAYGARAGLDIVFGECEFAKDLDCAHTRSGSNFSLFKAKVAGAFSAYGMKADGDVYVTSGEFAENVTLGNAVSAADLNLNGSTFAKDLSIDGAEVGRSFQLTNVTAEQRVSLYGMVVQGPALFSGSTFKGHVEATGMRVDGAMFLREVKRLGDINLIGFNGGLALQLRQSTLEGVIDLTGANVLGELHLELDEERCGPTWGDKAKLILRNAKFGALAGSINAFRKPPAPGKKRGEFIEMDLIGFSYDRLAGLGADIERTIAAAPVGELRQWLACGAGGKARFAPEPYRRFANALVNAGYKDKADQVLHGMRIHERRCERNWMRRTALGLSGSFIGFGHRSLSYGVAWFLTLTVLFAAIGLALGGTRPLDLSPTGVGEFLRWFWFSFGNAVPIFALDRANDTFLANEFSTQPPDARIYISTIFYLEKLLGFVILTYLAAGLSGLAKQVRD